MTRAVEATIGVKHGETCTCTPLDPISVSVEPVLVNRDCPGQRETPRDEKIDGRIIITWPRSDGPAIPGWAITVADADTGEQWANVLNLRITSDPSEITTAVVERLVDATGAATNTPVRDESGDRIRTAVFRYAVAEMRVAEEA